MVVRGLFIKILWAIAGVIPSVLLGTGVYMWAVKRKKKKASGSNAVILN